MVWLPTLSMKATCYNGDSPEPPSRQGLEQARTLGKTMEQQASRNHTHNRLAIAALALWSMSIVLVLTFLFDTWPHEWLKDDQREPWFHALVVVVLTLLAFFCNNLHHHVVEDRERRSREQKEATDAKAEEPVEGLIPKIFGSWFAIVIIFLLPTAAYFGAHTLHSPLPDPAIFVMAVVAIYVAAEHYASLDKQRENLRWVTEELGKQVFSIQNALGTKDGRNRIYSEYSQFAASDLQLWEERHPVYAIYRYFDIDEDWMRAGDWAEYMGSKQTTSLVAALRHGDRRLVRIVSPLPVPIASSGDDDVAAADRFHNFIGLVWHWLALRKLATENDGFDFRIAIADTPHWVHVVNRKVLQISGDYPHDLRVRDLTLDMSDMAPRLEQWVRDEIEVLCERGQSAQAFIGTVLMTALEPHEFDASKALAKLGWKAWTVHAVTRYGIDRDSIAHLRQKFAALIDEVVDIIGRPA